MVRPPLGSRWGDISPEQRAALPVGTVLAQPDSGMFGDDGPPTLTKAPDGLWYYPREWWGYGVGRDDIRYFIDPDRFVLSYPAPEPDPRDSDGPGSDEDGGEMRPP